MTTAVVWAAVEKTKPIDTAGERDSQAEKRQEDWR